MITLGSLYFVVLPLYQKSILDEAIAQKEIELRESEKSLQQSYEKLRTYDVNTFIKFAEVDCVFPRYEGVDSEGIVKIGSPLTINAYNCLTEKINSLSNLKTNDRLFITAKIEKIAKKIEQERTTSIKLYNELPEQAKTNPSLLKPLQPFAKGAIQSLEDFNAILNSAKNKILLDEMRFDYGVLAAQSDIESKYIDYSSVQIGSLKSLNWGYSK